MRLHQIHAGYWMLIGLAVVSLGLIGALFIPPPTPRLKDAGAPPFTAVIGATALTVPVRDDLGQPHLVGEAPWLTVHLQVCDRNNKIPADCEKMRGPVVNTHGVLTIIWPRRGAYRLLSERPRAEAPSRNMLVTIPPDQIDADIQGGGEAYELSRVTVLGRPLQTTDRGWPVAACGLSLMDGVTHQCGIGFLVQDTFVEAHWTAEQGVALTQAEVWSIASELDEKIRGLIATPDTSRRN